MTCTETRHSAHSTGRDELGLRDRGGDRQSDVSRGRDKEKVTYVLWLATCCPGTKRWHMSVRSHTHTCPLLSPCPSVTGPSALSLPYSYCNQDTGSHRRYMCGCVYNSIWPSDSASLHITHTHKDPRSGHIHKQECACTHELMLAVDLNVRVGSCPICIHLYGNS